jgi:hypothetical protein
MRRALEQRDAVVHGRQLVERFDMSFTLVWRRRARWARPAPRIRYVLLDSSVFVVQILATGR